MIKHSAEEAAGMIPLGGGRNTYIRAQLLLLHVGEALTIEKKDVRTKYPPYKIIKRIMKATGRKFIYGRRPEGGGWLVKRME